VTGGGSAEPLLVNVLGARTRDGSEGPGHRLLVLIHGYGADEHDLAPLAQLYDPDGNFFAVCPRGPNTVPPWGAGWYERGPSGEIDGAAFAHSADRLDATIDAVCAEFGYARREAVFVGFSQGCAMTLAVTLRSGAVRPAAICCLSGMLQEVDELNYDWDADDLPPVYVQHGTLDPLVEVSRGHRIRDTLQAHGVNVAYDEYPMGHEIRPESIADLRTWLSETVPFD